jgi:hypothetical protein
MFEKKRRLNYKERFMRLTSSSSSLAADGLTAALV